jgi:histidyl-tRNA synthetase
MLQTVKGMRDILPPESRNWERVQAIAGDVFARFGYSLSLTPVLEPTELFVRAVGEASDIVSKEMYSFVDKGGESVTMRPEGTASVMRAYLNDNNLKNSLFKTWYWGPMYRYERPQKGRYRQFYQYGLEAIGTDSALVDAEQIYMLSYFLQQAGLKEFSININTLGCDACRPFIRDVLVEYLKQSEGELCADCRRRIALNPMRVLDCKEDKCKSVVANAPKLYTYVCQNCKDHFNVVEKTLTGLNVPYILNPMLVRGLDYYCRTVFEFTSDKLGDRQNAIGGGGRYDGLSAQLGTQKIPAVGFAGGVERLMMLLDGVNTVKDKPVFYIAMLDDQALQKFMLLIVELKKQGVFDVCDNGFKTTGVKKHLEKANKLNAAYTMIVGSDELDKGMMQIKDMRNRTEKQIKIETEIGKTIENIIKEVK